MEFQFHITKPKISRVLHQGKDYKEFIVQYSDARFQ